MEVMVNIFNDFNGKLKNWELRHNVLQPDFEFNLLELVATRNLTLRKKKLKQETNFVAIINPRPSW